MTSTQEISALLSEKQQRSREQLLRALMPSKVKRKSDDMDLEAAFGQWFQALPVYSQRQILSSVDFESLEQISEVSAGNQRFRAEICDNDSFWVQWLDYHWPQHRLVTDAQVQAMGPRSKARYFAQQLPSISYFDRAFQFDPRVFELTIDRFTYVFERRWPTLSQNRSLTSLRIVYDRTRAVEFIQRRLDTFPFLTALSLIGVAIDDEKNAISGSESHAEHT